MGPGHDDEVERELEDHRCGGGTHHRAAEGDPPAARLLRQRYDEEEDARTDQRYRRDRICGRGALEARPVNLR